MSWMQQALAGRRARILITTLLCLSLQTGYAASLPCPSSTPGLGERLRSALRSILARPEKHVRADLKHPPEFLTKIDPENPEWVRLFVRYPWKSPEKPEVLRTLIGNATSSMKEFDRWFRGEKKTEFMELLSEQHRLLMKGDPEEARPYGGYFNGESWGDLRVRAGRFIHQVREGKAPERTERFPTQGLSIENEDSLLELENLPGQFFTEIEGIPPESWPTNTLKRRQGYLHQYPFISDHPVYLKRMGELLQRIRSEFGSADESQLLTLLADYYHVAINCHPFYRGNNSLFMAQVNYVLLMLGRPGVPHKNLDYLALASHSREFRRIFMNEVRAQESTAKRDLVQLR